MYAVQQGVPMGYKDGVDEDKSTGCKTLPQTEVAFPIGGVHGDDDLGVVPAEREGERERGKEGEKLEYCQRKRGQ